MKLSGTHRRFGVLTGSCGTGSTSSLDAKPSKKSFNTHLSYHNRVWLQFFSTKVLYLHHLIYVLIIYMYVLVNVYSRSGMNSAKACVTLFFKSLWLSDAVWRRRSGPTMARGRLLIRWYQAFTWINVDISPTEFSDMQLGASSFKWGSETKSAIWISQLLIEVIATFPCIQEVCMHCGELLRPDR